MYNILLGSTETMSTLLEALLKRSGFYVFTTRDFMSRVRGGHNFVQIRFGENLIGSHCKQLDGVPVIDKAICKDQIKSLIEAYI